MDTPRIDERVDVIVHIGRNVGSEPMDGVRWTGYLVAIRDALEFEGGTLSAQIQGESRSPWGDEQAYWVAASVPVGNVDALKIALHIIARRYRQQAIGITVGAYGEVRA